MDTCPRSLAAGANCTFNITFTAPGSGGFFGAAQRNGQCRDEPAGCSSVRYIAEDVLPAIVDVGPSSSMMPMNPSQKTGRPFPGILVSFLLASIAMILGVLLLGTRTAGERFAFRMAKPAYAALALVLLAILGMSACPGSGTGGGSPQPSSTTYTITVTATSGNISVPTTLTLTVTN